MGAGKNQAALGGAASGASAGASFGPWGALIGGVGGGLLGYLGGSDETGAAPIEAQLEAARGIPLPILKEYYPEIYQQVVRLNPEAETAINLGPSEMAGIATDPALRAAQSRALQELQDIGSAGGMNLTDKANLERILSETDLQRRGSEGAIMQNLAARGMAGGGQELVQRQMASQGASNLASQQGLDVAAQAQRRALQSIMEGGQLGGQMEDRQFSQDRAKAEAADAIARFNAANQQGVMSRGVAGRNAAQQWNAQNAQRIADQGADVRNQGQLYNIGLPQQQFSNQTARVGLGAAPSTALAGIGERAGARQNEFMGNLFQAGATAAGQWSAQDKKKKDDEGNL